MKQLIVFFYLICQIASAQSPLLYLDSEKGFTSTVWQDQSGNNNPVKLSAPTTKTTEGIYFNGNINALLTKTISLGNFTIYMSIKAETMNRTLFGTGISNEYILHYQDNAIYTATDQPFTFFNSNKLVLNQNMIITLTRDIAKNGNNVIAYRDGIQIGVFLGSQKRIFNLNNIAGEFNFQFKGWIKSICIYNTVHTPDIIKKGPPCTSGITPVRPKYNTLKVAGSDLLDQDGNAIMIRGINVDTYFEGYNNDIDAVSNAIDTKTKANAVRLAWWTKNLASPEPQINTTYFTPTNLDRAITKFKEKNIISVLMLHDLTGPRLVDPWNGNRKNVSGSDFDNIITGFWTSAPIVAILKNHQSHIIINIANEWGSNYYTNGGTDNDTDIKTYIDTYVKAIKAIRNVGINAPIMIDANQFGDNEQILTSNSYGGKINNVIVSNGKYLLNVDPLQNILFSVHTYEWKFNYATNQPDIDPTGRLNTLKQSGLTFVIGEMANIIASGKYETGYADFLTKTNQKGISYFAWDWYNDGTDDGTETQAAPQRMNITMGNDKRGDGVTLPVSRTENKWGYDIIYDTNFGINASLPLTRRVTIY